MPKKINVVSLSSVKDGRSPTGSKTCEVEIISEYTNEEQQLHQIKEETKKEEDATPVDEVVDDVQPVEAKPKPKPKRKPAVKKVKEEIEVVEQPKEEPKKTKTVELVECPRCFKEMTKRTLRYDHDKTCAGQKKKKGKQYLFNEG